MQPWLTVSITLLLCSSLAAAVRMQNSGASSESHSVSEAALEAVLSRFTPDSPPAVNQPAPQASVVKPPGRVKSPNQLTPIVRGGPARPGRRTSLRNSRMGATARTASAAAQVVYDDYVLSKAGRVRSPTLEQLRAPKRPMIAADSTMYAISQQELSAAYAQQDSNALTAAAAVTAGSSGSANMGVASICSKDPEFSATDYSRTSCRAFIHTGDGLVPCTAWFVSETHMVTAGHCIAAAGRYFVDPIFPGFVCCGFDGNGDCLPERTFSIVRWVTTDGFWEDAATANDGAVIKVKPLDPKNSMVPEPQRVQGYPGKVPTHVTYMDGFPSAVHSDVGCGVVNPIMRYQTSAQVSPLNYDAGAGGKPIQVAVSGCQGQSGGRVLSGGPNGFAYGIQTHGSTWCSDGRGVTGVTQITNTPQEHGVCVECLMAAIP